jgi:hypothetical protein
LIAGFSCKKSETPKRNFSDEIVKSTIEEVNEIVENFKYIFPSPAEIFEIIDEGSIEFNPEFLNPIENVQKYNDVKHSYTNFGVYLSDIVYCVFMGQNNEALKYLETTKEMGIDLRLVNDQMEGLIRRAQENVSNVDSLIDLTNDFFFYSLEELEDKNMHKAIAMICAGAYIEVLYIACESVDNFSENNPIIKKIVQQRYAFENLKDYAGVFKENDIAKSTYFELVEIKSAFDRFGKVEEETKLINNSDGMLIIEGGQDIEVTEEDFSLLKKKVSEIRNNITKIDND